MYTKYSRISHTREEEEEEDRDDIYSTHEDVSHYYNQHVIRGDTQTPFIPIYIEKNKRPWQISFFIIFPILIAGFVCFIYFGIVNIPSSSQEGSGSSLLSPTREPTLLLPTHFPTRRPSVQPTDAPTTLIPTQTPTIQPTDPPTSSAPTISPTPFPTENPTTGIPTGTPTEQPTDPPTPFPTTSPTPT